MDNGLIFPYPCERAHGESVILTTLNPRYLFSFERIGVWWMRGT